MCVCLKENHSIGPGLVYIFLGENKITLRVYFSPYVVLNLTLLFSRHVLKFPVWVTRLVTRVTLTTRLSTPCGS